MYRVAITMPYLIIIELNGIIDDSWHVSPNFKFTPRVSTPRRQTLLQAMKLHFANKNCHVVNMFFCTMLFLSMLHIIDEFRTLDLVSQKKKDVREPDLFFFFFPRASTSFLVARKHYPQEAMMAADCYTRGMELAIEGKFEEAGGWYDKAIEQSSTNPTFYVARALNHINLKNWIGIGQK